MLRPHGAAGRYEILTPHPDPRIEEGHHSTAGGKRTRCTRARLPGFGPKASARYVVPLTASLKLKRQRNAAAIHD